MKRRVLTALPVFNEAAHVLGVLAEVRKSAHDMLVVDDGSTDATPAILGTQPDVGVIRHPTNRGYGAALKSAFDYAVQHGYDVLVTIDCDGQHEPGLIPEATARVFPSRGETVDIVSGSRYLSRFANGTAPPEERRRINVAVTEFLNSELGLKLTDAFCGFKAYRVKTLRSLDISEPGYGMPLQLWIQAAALGLKIVEFPVPLVYLEEERSFGGSLDDGRQRMAYYQEVMQCELRAVKNTSHRSSNARTGNDQCHPLEATAAARSAAR